MSTVDGKGDRHPETRDRNLSEIVSRIQDDGPAVLGLQTPGCGRTADDPSRSEYDNGAVPQLLREAEPPEPFRASSHSDSWSPASGAIPAPPSDATGAKWRPASLLAVTILTATMVTGGVIAALYREPIETALRRPEGPSGDSALRQEIAAVQTSIEMLSERVEGIAGEGMASGQKIASGEPSLPATSQMPPPVSDTGGAEALEVRLDRLAHRLDSMAERVVRLISETERSPVSAPVEPVSPEQPGTVPAVETAAPGMAAADASALGGAAGRPRVDTGMADVPRVNAVPVVSDREAVGRSVLPSLSDSAPAPVIVAVAPAELAAPSAAPHISAEPSVPNVIANPNPGAVGTSSTSEGRAEPILSASPAPPDVAVSFGSTSDNRPVGPPTQDGASVGPERSGPLPDAAQKNLQRLAAILRQEVTILADTRTLRALGAETITEPASAAPYATNDSSPNAPGEGVPLNRDLSAVFGERGADELAETKDAGLKAGGLAALPSGSGEEWFINLVAVRRESSALDLQRTYRDKGVEAQVAALGRGLFGVRVGGFASRRDAEARADAIKSALGIHEVWIARR